MNRFAANEDPCFIIGDQIKNWIAYSADRGPSKSMEEGAERHKAWVSCCMTFGGQQLGTWCGLGSMKESR